MKFREIFENKTLSRNAFENKLLNGDHIQVGDDKTGDTLWLDSEGSWMFNTSQSTFAKVYAFYKQAIKDGTTNETTVAGDIAPVEQPLLDKRRKHNKKCKCETCCEKRLTQTQAILKRG